MSRMTSTRARIKLRRILQSTDNNVKEVMRKSADDLRDEMKENVPVHSGELRDLITSFVAKNGMRAEAGLRGKKAKRDGFYLRFLEFGTKAHVIKVKNRNVLSTGSEAYGKSVSHPGTPATPIIQPAWDRLKPQIQADVAKAINDAIRKAQQT